MIEDKIKDLEKSSLKNESILKEDNSKEMEKSPSKKGISTNKKN